MPSSTARARWARRCQPRMPKNEALAGCSKGEPNRNGWNMTELGSVNAACNSSPIRSNSEHPRSAACCASCAKNSRRNQSTLLDEAGEIDMFIHWPGRVPLRHDQRGSSCGRSERISLMLNVPAVIDTIPGSVLPIPRALDVTSCNPQATGIPSFRPVCAAACAVTRPAIAPDGTIGGNAGAIDVRPYKSSTSALYCCVRTSVKEELASVGSVAATPVRQRRSQSLQKSTWPIFAYRSGSLTWIHFNRLTAAYGYGCCPVNSSACGNKPASRH